MCLLRQRALEFEISGRRVGWVTTDHTERLGQLTRSRVNHENHFSFPLFTNLNVHMLNTSHTTKQYQSRISLKYIYQPPNQSCLTISIAFLWFRVRRNWEIDIIIDSRDRRTELVRGPEMYQEMMRTIIGAAFRHTNRQTEGKHPAQDEPGFELLEDFEP
ncbi:uncharacterized protein LAJ45_07706 [Morchella importuna]|uniref:uncharacterized protein n=1 Tax=Morchella importuna TaxID=1174673 RepID=UPI001E8D8BE8|nr:uncharacterized protein LAJ45_07706 [Morchella importuna]KAH8148254.1 hypothetical protein LAJ45_07706 [Morchella importuna]